MPYPVMVKKPSALSDSTLSDRTQRLHVLPLESMYLYVMQHYNSSCATICVGSGSSAVLAGSARGTSSFSLSVCLGAEDAEVLEAFTLDGLGMDFFCKPSTFRTHRVSSSMTGRSEASSPLIARPFPGFRGRHSARRGQCASVLQPLFGLSSSPLPTFRSL